MTNPDKIVIHGTPKQYDANELKARQEEWHHAYRETTQSCEIVRAAIPTQFLQSVIDYADKGYTLTDYPVSFEPLAYSAYMRKPVAAQGIDIAKINDDVRDAYKLELEADHAKYQKLLLEQLLQAEEIKQAKAVASAKEKLLTRLQKEVDACYAPLEFPDK